MHPYNSKPSVKGNKSRNTNSGQQTDHDHLGLGCRASPLCPARAEDFPKVVVIGAGMAGLSATRELRRKGWPEDKVVLLEASGEIGGRMRTRRHRSGAKCDVGAAYIHGTIGNPLTALASEAGVNLKLVSESNPWVENSTSLALYSRGKRATAAEVAETDDAFYKLMRRVTTRAQSCEDPLLRASDGIDEILEEEPFCSLSAAVLSRLGLRLFALSLWYGCDLKDMQLRSLDFGDLEDKLMKGGQGVYGDFPGPHCMVEGGVEGIVWAVANQEVRGCLRLNATVTRVSIVSGDTTPPIGGVISEIEEELEVGVRESAENEAAAAANGGVRVRVEFDGTGGGERRESVWADAVIVTVPLSLLQQGAVDFDPPIPEETRSAMSRLSMGNYEKIIIEFEEPFWPAGIPFIGCCPQPVPHCSSPCNADRFGLRPKPHTTAAKSPPSARHDTTDVKPQNTNDAELPLEIGATPPSQSTEAFLLDGARSEQSACVAVVAASSATVPVLLENYLYSKGVPVLTAAFTGELGRTVASLNGDRGEESDGTEDAQAREMYVRLVKPALEDAFGDGEELPDPVSVETTRGSYSFFPIGARDNDFHYAGEGVAMGAPGTAPGTSGADRVFFAGEATIAGYEGSMHGAYLSGVRAAEDVAHAFDVPV